MRQGNKEMMFIYKRNNQRPWFAFKDLERYSKNNELLGFKDFLDLRNVI